MTTVIDHAIAIPTRPAHVWDILRDISKNPTWHPDSQRVQLLTTLKTGRGLRWRNTTRSNKEQVFEITAWYDGLGYEYRIVDGSIYPNNRGRIRIQEAPEGTVVQWTFSYDVQGFLGGLRNRLSGRGHADKLIVQGLRNIYTIVKDAKLDETLNPEASKAYLKEAPNVEERASYQPRYPSKSASQEIPVVKLEDQPKQALPVRASAPSIFEPPVTDEDTQPNPSVQKSDLLATSSPSNYDEPDFLKAMPDQAPVQPLPMIDNTEEEARFASPEIPSIGETDTVDVKRIEPVIESQPDVAAEATVESLSAERDASKLDTATISVFELFGIEKPSETEQVRTLNPSNPSTTLEPVSIEAPRVFADKTLIIPDVQPDVPNRRRGLRAAMRSRFTKLRAPKSDVQS